MLRSSSRAELLWGGSPARGSSNCPMRKRGSTRSVFWIVWMTWLREIIIAMRPLGGKGRLNQIYHQIEANRSHLPDNWKAAVRTTIQEHSSDARRYVEGNPDVFCHISRGVWGLRDPWEIALLRLPEELRSRARSEITEEEFRPCAGDKDKLERLVRQKEADLRQRFGISG